MTARSFGAETGDQGGEALNALRHAQAWGVKGLAQERKIPVALAVVGGGGELGIVIDEARVDDNDDSLADAAVTLRHAVLCNARHLLTRERLLLLPA